MVLKASIDGDSGSSKQSTSIPKTIALPTPPATKLPVPDLTVNVPKATQSAPPAISNAKPATSTPAPSTPKPSTTSSTTTIKPVTSSSPTVDDRQEAINAARAAATAAASASSAALQKLTSGQTLTPAEKSILNIGNTGGTTGPSSTLPGITGTTGTGTGGAGTGTGGAGTGTGGAGTGGGTSLPAGYNPMNEAALAAIVGINPATGKPYTIAESKQLNGGYDAWNLENATGYSYDPQTGKITIIRKDGSTQTTGAAYDMSSGGTFSPRSIPVAQSKQVSTTAPTPVESKPVTIPVLPTKTAPIDTILYNEESIAPETMADLIFENIGGQELISIVRNDTVNGQNIIYQPIKNLGNIQNQYNPNNIIAMQETSKEYFNNFPIYLENKIPKVGNGPNGTNVYIDTSGNLVIDLVNMSSNEQVEIQIASGGTIYEAGI